MRLPSWPSLLENIKALGAVVTDIWQEIAASFDIHGVIYNRRLSIESARFSWQLIRRGAFNDRPGAFHFRASICDSRFCVCMCVYVVKEKNIGTNHCNIVHR